MKLSASLQNSTFSHSFMLIPLRWTRSHWLLNTSFWLLKNKNCMDRLTRFTDSGPTYISRLLFELTNLSFYQSNLSKHKQTMIDTSVTSAVSCSPQGRNRRRPLHSICHLRTSCPPDHQRSNSATTVTEDASLASEKMSRSMPHNISETRFAHRARKAQLDAFEDFLDRHSQTNASEVTIPQTRRWVSKLSNCKKSSRRRLFL